MAKDQVTARFNCAKCNTRIQWDSELQDDAVIHCSGCGERVGTLGALKALTMAKAQELANKLARDAFRKR